MASRGGDEWRFTGGGCASNAKLRVGVLAGRQFGRVTADQLTRLGVSSRTIGRWRDDGYLYRVLPRVYGVGHPGRSIEADLAAAVLYAGPGAMLSHGTAVWCLGLLKYPPREIVVSTPRRVRDHANIRVHGRRHLERHWHRGLPITSPSQALLDFAATGPAKLLRLALANADYHGLLNLGAIQRIIGRGIDGSAALRDALAIHLPQLAHTRSDGEVDLLLFCETHDIPIPEVNVYVHGHLIDALWREQRLVVEVDGHEGHHTPAQLYANHQRDLILRSRGLVVLRYAKRQFKQAPQAVAADVLRYI